jgi:hypothetical protein
VETQTASGDEKNRKRASEGFMVVPRESSEVVPTLVGIRAAPEDRIPDFSVTQESELPPSQAHAIADHTQSTPFRRRPGESAWFPSVGVTGLEVATRQQAHSHLARP